MPAEKHTKKANTPKKQRQWQHVRESMEARGASPGAAVRAASGVLKKQAAKRRRKGGSK